MFRFIDFHQINHISELLQMYQRTIYMRVSTGQI